MKMILSIGNNKTRRTRKESAQAGFTFIEIMVTIVILSLGLTLIYKALLGSLDMQRHLVQRLYAMNLASHRVEKIRHEYLLSGRVPMALEDQTVQVELNNKNITFLVQSQFEEVLGFPDLVKLNLDIRWEERGKHFSVGQATYLVSM